MKKIIVKIETPYLIVYKFPLKMNSCFSILMTFPYELISKSSTITKTQQKMNHFGNS